MMKDIDLLRMDLLLFGMIKMVKYITNNIGLMEKYIPRNNKFEFLNIFYIHF